MLSVLSLPGKNALPPLLPSLRSPPLSIPLLPLYSSYLFTRSTNCGVYLNAGREHAVASTKAFTSQVTVLSLIALWFAQHRNVEETKRRQLIDSLHRLPTNIGMALRCRDQCRAVAQKLLNAQHCFILGKGFSEPIAYEGALKVLLTFATLFHAPFPHYPTSYHPKDTITALHTTRTIVFLSP